MSGSARVLVALVTLGTVAFLLALVRRRRLRAKYALLWLVTALGMVAIAVVPSAVDAVAQAVGIQYGPALVFTGALLMLLLVCIHFSWELSRLEERTRSLAEELALRTLEVRQDDVADDGRPRA